ncbi:hypothetical protein ACFV42_47640 [Streptomyces solisilvae]|uniref:hypothetical protein n=1 Tax=Streptomyces malaysiensis TaxID=92644 RepID=UPI0036B83068
MTDQTRRQEAPETKTGCQPYGQSDPSRRDTEAPQRAQDQSAAVLDRLGRPDPRPTHARALHIDPDAASSRLNLPEDANAQHDILRSLIGDTADRAIYHRQALLHLHSNGAGRRLPVNPAAWALACVWRGLDLPYLLYGPVIVTGPDTRGVLQTLTDSLLDEAEEIARRTAQLRVEWSTRPPASEPAARLELLANARRATHRT